MSMNDPLASALSNLLNSEKLGKQECMIKPASKVIEKVLELLKQHKYINSHKEVEDSKGNYLIVNLNGIINKCGAIKPKLSVRKADFEKYEKRYLLGKNFGMLIVSTPQGIMTHLDAKNKNIGGRLLAYCY